jgi:aromatic ring hydroxylase
MRVWIGPVELNNFYSEQAIANNLHTMVLTDESLDSLGDRFQKTAAKHERGWTFDDWCSELIGIGMWR